MIHVGPLLTGRTDRTDRTDVRNITDKTDRTDRTGRTDRTDVRNNIEDIRGTRDKGDIRDSDQNGDNLGAIYQPSRSSVKERPSALQPLQDHTTDSLI